MLHSSQIQSQINYILGCGARYFPKDRYDLLYNLPIISTPYSFNISHFKFSYIKLPEWAKDIGVGAGHHIIVPTYCLDDTLQNMSDWKKCDWWQVCFFMVSGEYEREYEKHYGILHSYSGKLPKEVKPLFDYAWVNRIFLFLRRWAAKQGNFAEDDIFGKRPKPRITLTHDVDALSKTMAIRLKQTVFEGVNCLRLLADGQIKRAWLQFIRSFGFFFRKSDYNYLEQITDLEKRHNQNSIFNFYGGLTGWNRSPKKILLDPSYDITDHCYHQVLQNIQEKGAVIGLHQAFDSWHSHPPILNEKKRVEKASNTSVTVCRQHWLRFSWMKTWYAQEQAGFTLDMTLGFNDRPGFRTGSALLMPAWFASENRAASSLKTLPLILMDSHLFNYKLLSREERYKAIDRWLGEVVEVGGEASIVWHQRVFHPKDYGWGEDYEYVLSKVQKLCK